MGFGATRFRPMRASSRQRCIYFICSGIECEYTLSAKDLIGIVESKNEGDVIDRILQFVFPILAYHQLMSIKIADNSLKSLRIYFRSKLESNFDKKEIDAFFFRGLSYYLDIDRASYIAESERKISESDILKFRHLTKELLKNRPLQYIFGETDFMDLNIKVNEQVLIPRPETEEMVSDIVSKVKSPSTIIDFCTGSGCIAIALKNHFSNAEVIGVELSESALKIAKQNSIINNLKVEFINDNVIDPNLRYKKSDLIVANPPYVTESEKSMMQANVLDYEPAMALFVPDDNPLLFYKAIIQLAVDNLNSEGWLFLEINEKFGNEILALMKEAEISDNLNLNIDLNGKPRWVCGQKIRIGSNND
jgi:release factor glutamine methyltransferase